MHVQDYFKEVDPTSGLVTWKNPDDLPIPKEIKNDFVNECKSRMVLVSLFNDELIWAPTQEGKYSVKMGCLAISHQILDIKKSRAFMFCWNSIVLPKAGCFSWLALRKRILTGDRLQKLNIVQNFKCVLCLEGLESVDHLFVQCKVAQECWSFVLQKLNVMFPLPNTLWDLFNGWPSSNNHSFYACLWKCIPASVIWALWWERNKRIFRQLQSDLGSLLKGLESSIVEVVMAYVKKTNEHLIVTGWDILMSNRWFNLISPSYNFIISGPSVKTNRLKVHWIPPKKGFLKLNFDGCSRGNPGASGIGVCIRDHEGRVTNLLAKKNPSGTNNCAEAMALLFGVEMALKKNYTQIQIEGDSTLVINACLQRHVGNWKFGYILHKAWNLIDRFNSVIFSHTLREGNQVADILSNLGCDLQIQHMAVSKFDVILFPNLFKAIEKDKISIA